jgi:hypothetical protein
VTARTQVEFFQIGNLKPVDVFSVRYDPEDHGNWELGGKIGSAAPDGAEQSLDSASAGEIAAAVQATGDAGRRRSAADLLASGQRMTAVLREFSPSGKTVGDLNPALPDPSDPVHVFKAELPIDGSGPEIAIMTGSLEQPDSRDLRALRERAQPESPWARGRRPGPRRGRPPASR